MFSKIRFCCWLEKILCVIDSVYNHPECDDDVRTGWMIPCSLDAPGVLWARAPIDPFGLTVVAAVGLSKLSLVPGPPCDEEDPSCGEVAVLPPGVVLVVVVMVPTLWYSATFSMSTHICAPGLAVGGPVEEEEDGWWWRAAEEDDIISTSAGVLLSSTEVMVTFGRRSEEGLLISGVTGEDWDPFGMDDAADAAAPPPSAVGADAVLFTRISESIESLVSELSPTSKLWLIPEDWAAPLLPTPLSLSRNFKREKWAEMGTVAPERERANRSRFFLPLEFTLEIEPLASKNYK